MKARTLRLLSYLDIFVLLRRDAHNPYTFYCKLCGQQFDTYGVLGCSHHDTLESVGRISDPGCRCHHIEVGV